MNSLILACLLYLVCSAVGALGSEVTFSPGLGQVTGSLASGVGLLGGPADEAESDEAEDGVEEIYEDQPGGGDSVVGVLLHETPASSKSKKKVKGTKRKNRHRNKSTTTTSSSSTGSSTAFHPEHSSYISSYTPYSVSAALDPCTTSHLGFCIHGYCKYMEDLQEPVCVCMKGFDGLRCGIQTLGSRRDDDKSEAELVQTVLVIIAVVLSVISCTAILLMTCAHYRTHKNFMAAYLGSSAEVEKLQKPMSHVMV